MTTATKKHGVIVTVGGRFNTKTVWNRGHRMVTYRRQPSRIRFRSRMVSDKNQHLCGCWSWPGMRDINRAVERQLIAGRKPFGAMFFWKEQAAEAAECAKRLRRAGLVVREGAGPCGGGQRMVEACHDIRIRDIGDMSSLISDYVHAIPVDEDDLCREFNLYSGRRLKSFMGFKWDVEHNPLWVTGLILGYPIENTISCYHDAVS